MISMYSIRIYNLTHSIRGFDLFRASIPPPVTLPRIHRIIPLMPSGAFNICCPRDCVSRHNGGTSGAPLKALRVDSALRALSTLRGLRGAPEVPPLCRETQSLGQQMLNAPVDINGLTHTHTLYILIHIPLYIPMYIPLYI